MKIRKIIAVDFDGTLVENDFPRIGKLRNNVVERFKEEKKKGSCMILWTCRAGNSLADALKFSKENGIEFDYINENPECVFAEAGRKIFATEYWDDRAINVKDL